MVQMRRTKGFRSPKSPKPENTRGSVKTQRQRLRRAPRDEKAFGVEFPNSMAYQRVVYESESNEIELSFFAQQEDVKYAHNDEDWEALGLVSSETNATTIIKPALQEEPTTRYVRTPPGDRYLQDRELDLPYSQWDHAGIENWCSGVPDGTFGVFSELVEPETSCQIVQEVEEQYAHNERDWALLSDSLSDEGYYTFEKSAVEVVDNSCCLGNSAALENREADLAFFGATMSKTHMQRPPVIVIVENARTSMQSPNPGQAQFFRVGSFGV